MSSITPIKSIVAFITFLSLSLGNLAAYDPPLGGDALPLLISPVMMAGGALTASSESPMADAFNPAAGGGLQRDSLDLSYVALTGLGAEPGLGHILNIGLAFPQSFGVVTSRIGFIYSPFDGLDWGTIVTGRVGLAKALYPELLVGMALDLVMGDNNEFDWGLGLDLGVQGSLGDVGFLKGLRWGAALKNLGKAYAPGGVTGISGSTQATGIDSPYTLAMGMSAEFFKVPDGDLKVTGNMDLGFPSFQNVVLNMGLQVSWNDLVSLRSGWDFNLREAMANVDQGLVPSIGIAGTIKLNGVAGTEKERFRSGMEISPSAGAYQLPAGVWAFSIGSSIAFGVLDDVPPSIRADFPVPEIDQAYISPNADGVKDALTIPLDITDSRYVREYTFTVRDATGLPVRIFQDRAEWPMEGGLHEILGRMLYTMKDVKVPGSFVWDGRNDAGLVVPDGQYTITLEAWDDNRNQARSDDFHVTVDTAAPAAKALAPARRVPLIFSPDGNGEKDDFPITLETSNEDLWVAEILDAGGLALRQWDFRTSSPAGVLWDGRDKDGNVVADGLYSFQIQATDRAGNKGRAKVESIVVNTQRAPIGVAVKQGAFSPNGDGIMDSIAISPYVPIRAAINTWSLAVVDANGRVVWSEKGDGLDGFQDQFEFQGKDSAGKVLAEGKYRARLGVVYDNGHNPEAWSALFEADLTAPSISVAGPSGLNGTIFSPDGDGKKDAFAIRQNGSLEALWVAEILDTAGLVVRNWEFQTESPADILWDGRNQAGTLVPDGKYSYRIKTEDRAGNKGYAAIDVITLDTRRPSISLKAELPAFSPNGDGVMDELGLVPAVQDLNGLASWTLVVTDESGKTRWTQGGTGSGGLAERFTFKGGDNTGTTLPEGRYQAGLSLSYSHAYQVEAWSAPFIIDITPPVLSLVGPKDANALIFSPDGDGNKDTLTFDQRGSIEELWTAAVVDQSGTLVRSWEIVNAPPSSLTWAGKTNVGQIAQDGSYAYRISATDRAGNRTVAQLDGIVVDTRKPAVGVSVDRAAFSPNADGVMDVLTLGVEVPSKANVIGWTLAVVDALDKDRWTATGTAATAPQGSYVFTGQDSSGKLLPEATYRARLSVGYVNGFASTVWSPGFVMDVTAPSASLKVDQTAFNPLGEVRTALTITQSGSEEELWHGSMLDGGGKAVRTWRFVGKPEPSVRWDGFDDAGKVVADGGYTYRLVSTDKAGNSVTVSSPALVVNTEAKDVRLSLDRRAFSPNGDGVNDTLAIGPSSAASNISQWKLELRGQSGLVVRTITGRSALPQSINWDGKNDRGMIAADGSYLARILVDYTTGEQLSASSVDIALDTKPPAIRLNLEDRLFSPNGDGRKDTIRIIQDSDPGDDWEGKIVDAGNRVVRAWAWSERTAAFDWNGTDTQGKTVEDGTYRYIAWSADPAGNRTERALDGIVVDNRPTALSVSMSATSFNPSGAGGGKLLTLTPTVQLRQGIEAWRLELVDQAGTVRKAFRGTGSVVIPPSFGWDGKTDAGTIVEGRYKARLSVDYLKGDRPQATSPEFVLYVRVPSIRLSAEDKIFSPNGDGRKDTTRFLQDSDPGDNWEGYISDDRNRTVRSWTWKDKAVNFQWDGTDTQGKPVPDGSYRYTVWAEDAAGKKVERSVDSIVVDRKATPVSISASASGFSPNGDGQSDVLSLAMTLAIRDGIESWQLELIDQEGVPRRKFGGPGALAVPASIDWDGKADNGSVIQGSYTAALTVVYIKGDQSQAKSTGFILDSMGPRASIAITPKLFSPDNDGVDDELRVGFSVVDRSEIDSWLFEIIELAVVEGAGPAKERVFFSWRGRGSVPERLAWDGRSPQGELVEAATDYLYRFQVSDEWANSTKVEGVIAVDVLVMREGDRLKIKVPSIVFRPNFADFNALAPEVLARNSQVLKRIAEILNRFPAYRIQIEGHANSIAKMTGANQAAVTKEEQGELLPLSTARAELVRKQLVDFGVEARRLSIMGRGSSEPVVPFTDGENRWKNRRVEFILIRQ